MIITVSELTESLKKTLQEHYSTVFVKGELSNITHHTNGHLYFDLKDSKAKISGVLFNAKLKHLTQKPREGNSVIIEGTINIFAPQGRYQIISSKITFIGTGELLLKLEETKKKLSQLGWFDPNLKKNLPVYPKTIGVITSPTGAVIQDIINILSRRCKQFHLILFPVKVQGEGSAEEISRAIYFFNKHSLVDVLIVGRGGGSIEDLWSFNEEIVAEAIFKSQIPIISAVGHEIDVTLSDFVADVRAPTPSAAAEIVTKETQILEQKLFNLKKSTTMMLNYKLNKKKERINRIKIELSSISFHYELRQKLDFLNNQLVKNKNDFLKFFNIQIKNIKKNIFLFPFITQFKNQFNQINKNFFQSLNFQKKNLIKTQLDIKGNKIQLKNSIEKIISFHISLEKIKKNFKTNSLKNLEEKKLIIQKYKKTLTALHPNNILKRGFSILLDFNSKSVILSKEKVYPGQKILAIMQDGKIPLIAEETADIPLKEH